MTGLLPFRCGDGLVLKLTCFSRQQGFNHVFSVVPADMGYSRPGALPELGSGILQGCRLLRTGVRCECAENIRKPGQLAG